MARLLELASRFVNLGIVGSITPAGALMALALVLWMAEPKQETPSETLLYLFSPDYRLTQQLKDLGDSRRCENRKWQQAVTRVQAVFLERWTDRHGLREEARSALDTYQEWVKTHSGEAAQAGQFLAAAKATEALHRASVESLDARIAAARERYSEQIPVEIGGLFQSVMLILLLGWLIGIVLNPINKGLLDLFRPSSAAQSKEKGENGKNPGLRHPIYYIGKNVITQEEYEDLVNRYHRFAQILASLCLPVVALGWALSRWSEQSPWYQYSLCIMIGVAVLLGWFARRRYDGFHGRVECFISGRLRDIEEQMVREKKKELQVDLTSLANLIARVGKLVEDYQSCCCEKCKPKLDPCFSSVTDAVIETRELLKGARPCCCRKCKPRLDSCRAAVDNVVTAAKELLDRLKSCCCTEGKCKPDSLHKALKQVVAGIENLLDHLQSCCFPEPECRPNPCGAIPAKESS